MSVLITMAPRPMHLQVWILTATSGKHLKFLTAGGDESTNERMRITATGSVGIGNTSPAQKFDVNGNSIYGSTGTAGRVVISNTDGSANAASITIQSDGNHWYIIQ